MGDALLVAGRDLRRGRATLFASTKTQIEAPSSGRGTADLNAKLLNYLSSERKRTLATPGATSARSGLRHTKQQKLSNGKLKRRRRGATPEALVSKHRSAAPTLILAPSTPNAEQA